MPRMPVYIFTEHHGHGDVLCVCDVLPFDAGEFTGMTGVGVAVNVNRFNSTMVQWFTNEQGAEGTVLYC